MKICSTYVFVRGHCVRMRNAAAMSSTPDIAIRRPAPTNGGTPSRPKRMASQVLPHTQHMSTNKRVVRERSIRASCDAAALVQQQFVFARSTPTIFTGGAIGSDDAMAGDHERDLVRRAGARDGSNGFRLADRSRQLCVRRRRTAANVLDRPPDFPLERAARHVEVKVLTGTSGDAFANRPQRRLQPRFGCL